MPITLDQMIAAIPRARRVLGGLDGVGEAFAARSQRHQQAAQEKARLAEEQRQANLRDAQLRAQLAEELRHNQATEQDAIAKRELLARQAAGQQLGQVGEAVRESGGNPDVVRSAAPGLEAYGVHTTEQQTDPDVGGLGQLSQFPGMDFSLAPVPQMATGAFDFSGNAQGSIDAPAVREGQLAAARGALQRFANSGIPGITQPAHRNAAATAENVPFESPAKALEAASNLAEPEARNATSMVNAARVAEGTNARAAAGQGRLLRNDIEKAYGAAQNRVTQNGKLRDLNQYIAQNERMDKLLEGARGGEATQDPNALQQRAIIRGLLKANSPGAQSNYELQEWLRSGGVATQLETLWNVWAGGGQLSPRLVAMMKSLAKDNARLAHEERDALAEKASSSVHDAVVMMGADPETAEAYRIRSQREIVGGGEDITQQVSGGGAGGDSAGGSVGTTSSRSGILAIDPNGDDEWGAVQVDR